MMLSAVMMLRYLGENEGRQIRCIYLKVLSEVKQLTSDLGGSATTMEVLQAIKDTLWSNG